MAHHVAASKSWQWCGTSEVASDDHSVRNEQPRRGEASEAALKEEKRSGQFATLAYYGLVTALPPEYRPLAANPATMPTSTASR